MEFLDPSYKKKHRRMLFTGYAIVGLIILLLSTVLVLLASGYDINRGGKVVINSLLFIDSQPSDAEVYLDGKLQNDRTDARLVVPEGTYAVEIRKPGYVTWQKELLLEGQRVEFAKYPFLFPENPVSRSLENYSDPVIAHQSPDRRWLLVQNSVLGTYQLYDLDKNEVTAESADFSALSTTTFEPTTITVEEWSTDNQNILVSATDGEQTKYFIYRLRSDEPPVEILAAEPVKSIRLNDRKVDRVYMLYASGSLVSHDVNQGTDQVVATSVLDFEPYDSNIFMYVTPDTQRSLANVVISEDLDEYVLQSFAYQPDTVYSMAIARFEGDFLYAVGASNSERMTVYENPLQSLTSGLPLQIISKPRVDGLREIMFSNNARFIAGLVNNGFVVYDAEETRNLRFDVAGLDATYAIRWMDGHRLVLSHNGQVSITEFDGHNTYEFGQALNEKSVFFDSDYEDMYRLLPAAGATSLQETQLRIRN